MKSSIIIARASVFVIILTISECTKFKLQSEKQQALINCGTPIDPSTELGRCTVYDYWNNDFEIICGGNCPAVIQECLGPQFVEKCDAITVSATLIAIVIAVVAAFN